jgi:small-conductance mechanosensitive channel
MGGRHTVERIIQQPDPATLALLKEITESNRNMQERFLVMTQEMNKIREETGKAEAMREEYTRKLREVEALEKDPKRIVEAQNKLFDNLVDKVREQFAGTDWSTQIGHTNSINVAFIGRVASGKSTVINALVGSKVAKAGGKLCVCVRVCVCVCVCVCVSAAPFLRDNMFARAIAQVSTTDERQWAAPPSMCGSSRA